MFPFATSMIWSVDIPPPVRVVTYLDNFTRQDQPLENYGEWTLLSGVAGGIGLASESVTVKGISSPSAFGNSVYVAAAQVAGGRKFSSVVFRVVSASGFALLPHVVDASNYLEVSAIQAGLFTLTKVVAGVKTLIGSPFVVPALAVVSCEVSRDDGTVTPYVNGAVIAGAPFAFPTELAASNKLGLRGGGVATVGVICTTYRQGSY